MDKSVNDFRHKYSIRVRNYEVDSQGIVHNSVYLQYLEIGRIEYRRNLGYNIKPNGVFDDGLMFVVVNNTINYLAPAMLDEELDIYTKISWVKKSSFCFEQQIVNKKGIKVCNGSGVLVNLNVENKSPLKISDKFISEVQNFEKELTIKND